jgi:hypothetical protein
MAGDWIKLEIATSDKPEVWQIAESLGIDPDAVVGKLIRVWAWFDQQTLDGNAKGNATSVTTGNGASVTKSATMALLDRKVGVTGFCAAMISVGWMLDDGGALTLPNFDRHNGKTAKTRALTAKRVSEHKKKGNATANALVTVDALPREEKRREEKIVKNTTAKRPKVEVDRPDFVDELTWQDWKAARKGAKITVTVMRGIQEQADIAGIELAEAIKFAASKSWRSFEAEWYFKATGNKPPKWDHIPKD